MRDTNPDDPKVTRPPVPALSAEALQRQLERVGAALQAPAEQELIDRWRRLSTQLSSDAFSVVVAGEFSRGKSTLMNQLLGRDLLPVGILPTTAAITRVRGGEQDLAVWTDAEGAERPLAIDGLSEIIDLQEEADGMGSLRLQLKDPWLTRDRVELIDTPGVNDQSAEREAAVIRTIAGADAALVVVSAVTPMSMTEHSFIDAHVLPRDIPRIALVVTHLDLVRPRERLESLQHIAAIRDDWVPEAKIWTAQELDGVGEDAPVDGIGLDAIRAGILAWVNSPDHQTRRRQQASTQLYAIAGHLQAMLTEQAGVLSQAKEDLTAARATAQRAVDDQRLLWDDLHLDMRDREDELRRWVKNRLSACEDDMLAKFSQQLQATNDPAEWYNSEFPITLRRELANISKNVETKIEAQLREDGAWLSAQVRDQLGWQLPSGDLAAPSAEMSSELSTFVAQSDEGDVLLDNVIGFATGLAFRFIAPLAPVIAIGGALLKSLLKDSSEDVRRQLLPQLGLAVSDALEGGGRQLTTQLGEVYTQLLQNSRAQETLWSTSRAQTVAALGQDEDPSEALAAVQARRSEVNALLGAFRD